MLYAKHVSLRYITVYHVNSRIMHWSAIHNFRVDEILTKHLKTKKSSCICFFLYRSFSKTPLTKRYDMVGHAYWLIRSLFYRVVFSC